MMVMLFISQEITPKNLESNNRHKLKVNFVIISWFDYDSQWL